MALQHIAALSLHAHCLVYSITCTCTAHASIKLGHHHPGVSKLRLCMDATVAESSGSPDHLLVLVHGLADTKSAWDRCVVELRNMPDAGRCVGTWHVSPVARVPDGSPSWPRLLPPALQHLPSSHGGFPYNGIH